MPRPSTPTSSGVIRVSGSRRFEFMPTIAHQADDRGDFGEVRVAERRDLVLRPEEQQDREDQQPAPSPVPRLEAGEPERLRFVGTVPPAAATAAGTGAWMPWPNVRRSTPAAGGPAGAPGSGRVASSSPDLPAAGRRDEPGQCRVIHHHERQRHPGGAFKQLHGTPPRPAPASAARADRAAAP